MKKVRIDKWLWSVRIFKSRSLATEACKSGKVKIEDKSVKPSYLVTREEVVTVRKNGFNLVFKVVDLIDKRVSFTLAEPCYENLTPADELSKYQDWFVGKARPEHRERGAGRPTKRERRQLDGWKEEDFFDDED